METVYEIASQYGKVIAITLAGSELYNTKVNNHDKDYVVITVSGKPRQVQVGDIDIRIISADSLVKSSRTGSLQETETVLALQYGYVVYFDTPWTPMVMSIRPDIHKYMGTIERYLRNKDRTDKHAIRHRIISRRFWDTGDANPRLTETERAEWLTAVHPVL